MKLLQQFVDAYLAAVFSSSYLDYRNKSIFMNMALLEFNFPSALHKIAKVTRRLVKEAFHLGYTGIIHLLHFFERLSRARADDCRTRKQFAATVLIPSDFCSQKSQ
jgi:hypothetical protein